MTYQEAIKARELGMPIERLSWNGHPPGHYLYGVLTVEDLQADDWTLSPGGPVPQVDWMHAIVSALAAWQATMPDGRSFVTVER